MTRNNDFSSTTKTNLSKRAGYKCCYLGCGQATIGPSREKDNTGTSNTGTAAHIYSASSGKGARRKPPPGMKPEEIINIQNGIWMCRTHGTHVDNDEKTFSVEQLRKWKIIGEKIAAKMQEFRVSYIQALDELKLVDPKISAMVDFAKKHDPSTNRYDTLDLLLYKKILEMLPESIIFFARQGLFINRHEYSLREKISYYLHMVENNPVDFSFHQKAMQIQKEKMDDALIKLSSYLGTVTFADFKGEEKYFMLEPTWKQTPEKSKLYETAVKNIYEYSDNFVKEYDTLYRLCHDYFLE